MILTLYLPSYVKLTFLERIKILFFGVTLTNTPETEFERVKFAISIHFHRVAKLAPGQVFKWNGKFVKELGCEHYQNFDAMIDAFFYGKCSSKEARSSIAGFTLTNDGITLRWGNT